ncbi:hypothetical protein C8A00DRAFT_14190 [Chaetomidium leptoderma]|uniref:Uncharacterized protein n=1 Tax=Chaetomidium leptoderma TaxID=669021 RepID=A0AAN6VP35_9PEZI|nr:hypothetical protein C8A00DRAFT_14190 [Chaetomidium leptoderma]
MCTVQRVTNTLLRAIGFRAIATRTITTDSLRTRSHQPSSHHPNQPATSANTILEFASSQSVFGRDWPATTHRDTTDRNPRSLSIDERSRAFYSTQIYHGQACPSHRRGMHSDTAAGPQTGAGTGVVISAQMFGTEVKGNPTESEADVAADRSDLDPLPPGKHHTIRLGPGEAGSVPTESEADVAADRGGADLDPLGAVRKMVR